MFSNDCLQTYHDEIRQRVDPEGGVVVPVHGAGVEGERREVPLIGCIRSLILGQADNDFFIDLDLLWHLDHYWRSFNDLDQNSTVTDLEYHKW